MTNNVFKGKIIIQIFVFVILMSIIMSIKINNVLTVQNSDDIIYLDQQELKNRKRIYELELENGSLKQLIIETSDIPNEKRKSVFELKIQQDSILIDMLKSDMNTNKDILRLLDTDWKFNNDTEFKSVKTK